MQRLSPVDPHPWAKRRVARRRVTSWALLWVVVLVLGLGWWYPWVGFAVPVVMLAGFAGSLVRGRYVCGNLCPRGAFLDRLLGPLSRRRSVPRWMRGMALRWALFAALMGLLAFRVAQSPGDVLHWGRVFWMMCAVTTVIGIVLAVLFSPRAWCTLCPMGTVQRAIGGTKRPLAFSPDRCRTCRLCEERCPMGLEIVRDCLTEQLTDPDCIRCSECAAACPTGALSWARKDATPLPHAGPFRSRRAG